MSHLPLHGFTLIRNGVKYDYPFRESLSSLRALCESVVVAVGDSTDSTEAELAKLDLVQVPTVWDEGKRQGGVILSEQTNIALEALRKRVPGSAWGFYLQADEVISEQDYDLIQSDLARAEAAGCDAISFRYLHFWQSYERIAVGKRWYPQEIRCVRLDSKAESYGDAQSFRHWTKRFESEAVIFHYGHVREAKAYELKKKDFHRWWHGDNELASVIARGEKGDKREETLAYLGPHPRVMKISLSPSRERALVFGDPSSFSKEFISKLQGQLEWTLNEHKLFEEKPEDVVLMKKVSPLTFALSMGRLKSKVPTSMGSPQAREWTQEFQALLRFSERGVRVL